MSGFPQAFPIFQAHLSSGKGARFPNSMVLPLLAPGIQDILEGILFQFLPKATKHRRAIVASGICIMSLALLAASFASTALQVVAIQGVLFGFGGILLNFVHVSVFSEWFDKKRGQAMGFIWSGFRLGGFGFPLVCQWLLDKHGFQKTLRVLIAPMLALLIPSILLLRGRYTEASVILGPDAPKVSKRRALRTPTLPLHLLVAVLFALVTNVPMMFISQFAADLGLRKADCALSLSLVFLGNILGPYILGRLSDRISYPILTGASALSTSMTHIFVLGFVKTKAGVFCYSIVIGLTTGGEL